MVNDTGMDCATCGMRVAPANAYHPHLYCELRKLGHLDPEAHLRSYGFERRPTLPPEHDPREPELWQVWREKARQYNQRTVVVVGFVDDVQHGRPGRFVQVRTLTDYSGQPVNRKAITKVRVDNWHKAYVFDREEA